MSNTELLTLQSNVSSNNSAFIDKSYFNNIINRTGNVTNGTFSPYGDNWSTYFNGSLTNQYLSFPTATATALGGFNGNITTIEGWFFETVTSTVGYYNDVLGAMAAVAANGRFQIGFGSASATNSPSKVQFMWTTGTGSTDQITTTGTLAVNSWNHVAIVVDATGSAGSHTVSVYINGTRELFTSRNFSTQTFTYDRLCWGGYTTGFFNGYISNFRFTRATTNTVGYSGATITPPTSQLQPVTGTKLLFNSNRFVDSSILQNTFIINGTPSIQKFSPFSTVTVPKYYSTKFDGTGDYLSVPYSSSFAPPNSTSAWTVELWFYATTNYVGNQSLFRIGSAGYSPIAIVLNTSNLYIDLSTSGSAWNWSTGAKAISLNTWNHVALVRDGATTTAYLNGVSYYSSSSVTLWNPGTNLAIGAYSDGSSPFPGYISNVRVMNGGAAYTSNFTPSTTPLTAVSGTVLLTCQDSTFKDNSTNNFTITATGDAKPLPISPFTPTASSATSYSPSVFGGSMYFDGSGDYLSIPHTPNHWMSSGDFTIDLWIYPTKSGEQCLLSKQWQGSSAAYASYNIYIESGGTFRLLGSSNGGIWDLDTGSSTATYKLNEWQHIAVTRTGNTFRLFVNGILEKSTTFSSALYNHPDPLVIGAAGAQVSYGAAFGGYMSDVRIIKGSSLYTSNFYPGPTPTTPTPSATLLVSGTSSGIIDQTRTVDLETIADTKLVNFSPYNGSYYSNYFDGSGDYLYKSLSPSVSWTNTTFTLEAWVYPQSLSGDMCVFSTDNGNSRGLMFGIKTDGSLTTDNQADGASIGLSTGSEKVLIGRWNHIAITISGSTVTYFVNGILSGTSATGAYYNQTSASFKVGSTTTPGKIFNGQISNLRFVTGNTLYTSNFTPSTTPLTAVSGTSLLTCQSNTFKDNSTNNFTITPNGDVKVRTQNPFQNNTGTSVYFDGTGDYLTTVNASTTMAFGSGDFTIEFWLYMNTLGTGAIVLDFRPGSTNGLYPTLYVPNGTTTLRYLTNSADRITSDSGTIVAGNWYHVALVRASSVTKLYINGNQAGSNYNDTNSYLCGTNRPIAGASGYDTTGLLNGYITDLRITKGVARTITVPTSPLTLK